jgi:hypothetical protein
MMSVYRTDGMMSSTSATGLNRIVEIRGGNLKCRNAVLAPVAAAGRKPGTRILISASTLF